MKERVPYPPILKYSIQVIILACCIFVDGNYLGKRNRTRYNQQGKLKSALLIILYVSIRP